MSATKTKIILGAFLALFLISTAVTCLVVFFLPSGGPAPGSRNFADLRESDIPGRYKWTEGRTQFFIVLYDDHTFMNKDGTVFPMYRWDVTPDGLSFTWQRNTTVFTNIEAAGIYTGPGGGGAPLRLEKLPPYAPAQQVPAAPIATLRLDAQCKTNGLTPVSTGDGDGEILPGSVAGVGCQRLVRNANKPDAYLYLQIAPELKDPPFTNALVIVEFFDRASAGGRPGRLVVQYENERGAYANSEPLHMNGSQTWQEATFYLPNPLFQNGQNGGADFRLVANRSELPVRSVKLVKNANLPETKMPALKLR